MFACLYKPENGARHLLSPGAPKKGSDPISGARMSEARLSEARLLAVARQFSPRVDTRVDGLAILEIDGLTRLFGIPRHGRFRPPPSPA